MASQRTHERFELEIPLAVEFEGQTHTATSKNISIGGMLVTLEGEFPLGAELVLHFELPNPKHKIHCKGHVRWRKPGGLGIQFDSLRAKDVWALNQLFRRHS